MKGTYEAGDSCGISRNSDLEARSLLKAWRFIDVIHVWSKTASRKTDTFRSTDVCTASTSREPSGQKIRGSTQKDTALKICRCRTFPRRNIIESALLEIDI
jgi:hypothetical protein